MQTSRASYSPRSSGGHSPGGRKISTSHLTLASSNPFPLTPKTRASVALFALMIRKRPTGNIVTHFSTSVGTLLLTPMNQFTPLDVIIPPGYTKCYLTKCEVVTIDVPQQLWCHSIICEYVLHIRSTLFSV
ncbi:MAG: hypothetical protein LBB15_01240 [Puniceicoccales bacterium]|nr:hypothetical protein [Puniceicoccales bacterium]